MRQCDRYPLSAIRYPLSAVGYRLSAVGCPLDGIPERGRRQTVRHQTSDILYSRQQEGSGAFGARVLSFVCFAPNDGFCPQSGLVSREALPMAVKTFTTGLAPDGNAPPFGADAPPFPRRGNFSCRLALGLMSTTKYHAAKISPSGGDVAAGDRRGAFPMWRPCRGSPSRAKLVPGLHIKGLSNKSPDRCRRRGFTVLPPTGGIINSLPQSGNT